MEKWECRKLHNKVVVVSSTSTFMNEVMIEVRLEIQVHMFKPDFARLIFSYVSPENNSTGRDFLPWVPSLRILSSLKSLMSE